MPQESSNPYLSPNSRFIDTQDSRFTDTQIQIGQMDYVCGQIMIVIQLPYLLWSWELYWKKDMKVDMNKDMKDMKEDDQKMTTKVIQK